MKEDSIEALRDIHLPPPPDLVWPFTQAGVVLAGLLLVVSAWLAWRRRRRLAPLRAALRELAALASAHARDGDADRLVGGLSTLLRAYALERFPHERVAGLVERGWLDFLDAHGGEGAFSAGLGAVLAWRPYRPDGEVDAAALIDLAGRWLRRNPP